jgi:hypothetical protein
MRQARDTFLHFLADNLPTLTIHNLRHDPNFPSASQLQMEGLNIQFLNDSPRVDVSGLTVTIDATYANELDAVDAMTTVWKLLQLTGYTRLTDYSDPNNLIVHNTNLVWDTTQVRFRPVFSDTYTRFSCLLALSYQLY